MVIDSRRHWYFTTMGLEGRSVDAMEELRVLQRV